MQTTFFTVINIVTKLRTIVINRNGSNRIVNVKFIVFGFVTLGFPFASSLNKYLPLNSTPFNLTNSL